MKRIIDTLRGWASALDRNPRTGARLSPPDPITPETVRERVKHVAPLMNMWGRHLRWMEWAPDHRGLRHFYGHFPNRGLRVGDWVVQEMATGQFGILEIVEMEWKRDPDDMFFGYAKDVGFLPEGMKPDELCRPKAPSPSDASMLRVDPEAVTSHLVRSKLLGG
jgi:hypothetical protein